jgi:hypothetical protein
MRNSNPSRDCPLQPQLAAKCQRLTGSLNPGDDFAALKAVDPNKAAETSLKGGR